MLTKSAFVISTAIFTAIVSQSSAIQAQSCIPQIAHWEYTQAIQDDLNSVALVDQRAMTVRTYWTVPVLCAAVTNHSASLRVLSQGIQIVGDSNGVTPDNGEAITVSEHSWNSQQRTADWNSLDFAFTPNLAALGFGTFGGVISLEVCPHSAGSSATCQTWSGDSASILPATNALLINAIDVDYKGRGRQPRGDTDRPVGNAMVQGTYPFVNSMDYYRFAFTGIDMSSGLDNAIEFNLDIEDVRFNNQHAVNALKLFHLLRQYGSNRLCLVFSSYVCRSPDYVFGWIKGNALSTYNGANDIIFEKGAGVGYGHYPNRERAQYTLAHEVGHWFYSIGPVHPVQDINDTGWDVLNIGARIFPAGPNQGKPARLHGARDNDFMNGGETARFAWVSIDHYRNAVQRLGKDVQIVPTPILLVDGSIVDGEWSIEPMVTFTRENLAPVLPSYNGTSIARLLDSQHSVIYETAFSPQPVVEGGVADVLGFGLDLPASPAAQTLELEEYGVVKLSVSKSENSPEVSIVFPTPGAVITTSTEVSWTAVDVDGDSLRTIVQYSHDGMNWATLAVNLIETHFTLPSQLASSLNGTIKLITTDGFTTVETIVGMLVVGSNLSPTALILTPNPGDEFPSSANITLHASGVDAEDVNIVDTNSITWESDRDGLLGYGHIINVTNLSSGIHTIILKVVDSQGAQDTDSIEIYVY